MRGAMRNIVSSIVVVALAASLPSCINADPSLFYVDAGADITRPDIMVDDSGDEPPPDPKVACKACLEAPDDPGPGCQSVVDPCKANENCLKIYDCALEKGCMQRPATQEIQLCGYTNCIAPAGIAITDLGVTLATAVAQCDFEKCNPNPCGPTP
jgi:hypothetical protein